MSVKTDERLDEVRRRIGELEAKAQAAGDREKQSIKGQVAALRQHIEATQSKLEAADDTADAKIEQLQTRLEAAEHAVSAELAEDRQSFSDAMQAYLDDFNQLSTELHAKAGSAREQADAAIGDIRQSRDAVAERLAQTRTASGERWRESKASVAAARAELERKADAAMEKLR
jgi:chromosome segregation ATPase